MTVLDNNLHGDGIKFHDFRAVSSPIAYVFLSRFGIYEIQSVGMQYSVAYSLSVAGMLYLYSIGMRYNSVLMQSKIQLDGV